MFDSLKNTAHELDSEEELLRCIRLENEEMEDYCTILRNQNAKLQKLLTKVQRERDSLQEKRTELKAENKRLREGHLGKAKAAAKKVIKHFVAPLLKDAKKADEVDKTPKDAGVKKKFCAPALDGISVVIPTYRPNKEIYRAVDSVLKQTYRDVEVIIACNGPNKAWAEELTALYEKEARVKVCHTPKAGAGTGRNLGIANAGKSYTCFLDDDDYFSEGYLEELASRVQPDVELIHGRLMDTDALRDTYIDKALRKFHDKGPVRKAANMIACFSTITAKLFVTSRLQTVYEPFPEDLTAGEDVAYWLKNFKYIQGCIDYGRATSKQGYMRGISADSTSRPDAQRMIAFYRNWLKVFDIGAECIFDPDEKLQVKTFAANMLSAQNATMRRNFEQLDLALQEEIRPLILEHPCFFVNKGLFSGIKGVAFCHNFSPFIDPSAIVAPKRLRQICELEKAQIGWTVISKDMENIREKDERYEQFFSRFGYVDHIEVKGYARSAAQVQMDFGKMAYQKARDLQASFIYSRSMFPGSHIAAYLYKQTHPDAVWYAEFSDPVLYTPQNTERPADVDSDDPFLQDFWNNIEQIVYEAADHIIFTNENQYLYMMRYNRTGIGEDQIKPRTLILAHPLMPFEFTDVMKSAYEVDSSRINVGYFGSLPEYRDRQNILNVCKNPAVTLHLFTINTKNIEELSGDNIKVAQNCPYLEFLNLAKKFDYLIVMDSDIDSDINPWLPSKVSDAISTGTSVIAIYKEGSAMSKVKNEKFVFTKKVDQAFANSLTKQKV